MMALRTKSVALLVAVMTVMLSGCFLIISHEDYSPGVITAHLLPPKIDKTVRAERGLDASFAVLPFEFDLKVGGKQMPFYLDMSHIPREFHENLLVMIEERFIKNVFAPDRSVEDDDTALVADYLKTLKVDAGIWGRVKKLEVEKAKWSDMWRGELEMEVSYITATGILIKTDTYKHSFKDLRLPDNMSPEYQLATATSDLFNNAYAAIAKDMLEAMPTIEAHKSLKDVVKGKGIITFRRGGKYRGKTRMMVDVKLKILLNEIGKGIIGGRAKQAEKAKAFVEEMKEAKSYKLELVVRDAKDTIYPFETGRLVYDPILEEYFISLSTPREFQVTPGKGLVVANFVAPKVKEVVSKGVYVDVHPEKGASAGMQLICDTKNNFVDMVFLR